MKYRHVVAVGCGAVFGLGLAVSQMTLPSKVICFLDVAGDWDPSLLFVLGGAVCVTALAFRFVLRLQKPMFDSSFEERPKERIDFKLLIGSGLFGIGWGLSGFCPGPGIVSLTRFAPNAYVFMIAFVAGSAAYRAMDRMQQRRLVKSA